jgi:hypothetical protein
LAAPDIENYKSMILNVWLSRLLNKISLKEFESRFEVRTRKKKMKTSPGNEIPHISIQIAGYRPVLIPTELPDPESVLKFFFSEIRSLQPPVR